MARGKRSGPSKADRRRQAAERLSREEFFAIVSEAKAARQELDDASTAHASTFKKADGIGVHTAALKLFLTLDKMEHTKRTDYLRAFDQYRDWCPHWDEQPDLFQAEAAQEGTALQAEAEAGDETEAPLDAEVAEMPLAADPAEPDVESDGQDEAPAADQPELDRAGFVYADGQKAGAEGFSAEQNPHGETSALHAIWERGRVNPAAAEAEASEEPAPERSKRSRRRANGASLEVVASA